MTYNKAVGGALKENGGDEKLEAFAMAISAPVLFTLAGIAAALTIWSSLRSALPAMRLLRAQLADNRAERLVTVSTLETRDPRPGQTAASPLRHRGRARPKPIKHRLHHFAKAAEVA